MRAEEWRVIDEAPNYEVSSIGRVRRRNPDWQGKYEGRLLQPNFVRGYARYKLCVDGRQIMRGAHALVCTAFNGPKPHPKMHCAHRDDDKANNTPGNLYWATPAENMKDAIRNGRVWTGPRPAEVVARWSGENHYTKRRPELIKRGAEHWKTGTHGKGAYGERTGAAKLTEAQVLEILAAPTGHGTGRQLAERYGVSMGLISAIRKRRAWAYLHRRSLEPA